MTPAFLRHALALAVHVVLTVGLASGVSAQTWPSRPITFLVPYAAGGNVDISARILQTAIGDTLGQPIIVENRVGAGGLIAGEAVARSAPDGHTVFIGANGAVMLGPMTMAKPPYHWKDVFAPVSILAVATNIMTVRPTFPAKTVAELVAFAKANPGKLTIGNSGGTSINHFMGELLKLEAGITWAEVHYRGNAQAINDLVAGHVDMGLQQLSDTLQHIQGGKLKPLAVLGPKRSPQIPDVPTMAEAGYPKVQGLTWNGLLVAKATPAVVVDQLSAAVRRALAKPEVQAKFAALGSEATGNTPAEFLAFLETEQAKWSRVMKDANIKLNE